MLFYRYVVGQPSAKSCCLCPASTADTTQHCLYCKCLCWGESEHSSGLACCSASLWSVHQPLTETSSFNRPTMSCLYRCFPQGCRKHLEAGFANHMTSVISRHRSTAQRGADPDPLRDVQAFLAVKFRDKGVLDINATGGIDTTWTQVIILLYFMVHHYQHDVWRTWISDTLFGGDGHW